MDRRTFLKKTAAAEAAAVLPILIDDGPLKPMVKTENRKFVCVRILILDRPTKNMNVYPRVAIEKMMDRIPEGGIMGQIGMPHDAQTNLSQVSHLATNFQLLHDCDTHEDWLACDITLLDTPQGQLLRRMIFPDRGKLPLDVIFRTACRGNVSQEFHGITPCQEERYVNIVQDNVELLGVHVIPGDQDTCGERL